MANRPMSLSPPVQHQMHKDSADHHQTAQRVQVAPLCPIEAQERRREVGNASTKE